MGGELRAGSELAAEQAVTQYRVDPARPWAESIDHRPPPNTLLVRYSATRVVENDARAHNSPNGLYRVARQVIVWRSWMQLMRHLGRDAQPVIADRDLCHLPVLRPCEP